MATFQTPRNYCTSGGKTLDITFQGATFEKILQLTKFAHINLTTKVVF